MATANNPVSHRKISASAWVIIVVALGLNFWLDYNHPTGWFLDIIFVVYLVIKLYRSESRCEARKQIVDPTGPTEDGTRSGNS